MDNLIKELKFLKLAFMFVYCSQSQLVWLTTQNRLITGSQHVEDAAQVELFSSKKNSERISRDLH